MRGRSSIRSAVPSFCMYDLVRRYVPTVDVMGWKRALGTYVERVPSPWEGLPAIYDLAEAVREHSSPALRNW